MTVLPVYRMEPKILPDRRFNRYLQDFFSQQRECYEQFGE